MRPVWIVPQAVPQPTVRRLEGAVHEPAPVQQVAVRAVPAPRVVPRQLEDEDLRADLDELRTA